MSTLVERLKHLRKEYRKTSFTICRLKEKIRQSCDMQGTTVGEELHKDLKAITDPNVSQFAKNTQALRVVNSLCKSSDKGNCCLDLWRSTTQQIKPDLCQSEDELHLATKVF